jgi:hypothetical protein
MIQRRQYIVRQIPLWWEYFYLSMCLPLTLESNVSPLPFKQVNNHLQNYNNYFRLYFYGGGLLLRYLYKYVTKPDSFTVKIVSFMLYRPSVDPGYSCGLTLSSAVVAYTVKKG